MKKTTNFIFSALAAIGFAAMPMNARGDSCFEFLDDGTVVVTDCWSKDPCIRWSSNTQTLKNWIANAVLDDQSVSRC